MYKSKLVPIMDYCSSVWGFKLYSKPDTIHNLTWFMLDHSIKLAYVKVDSILINVKLRILVDSRFKNAKMYWDMLKQCAGV